MANMLFPLRVVHLRLWTVGVAIVIFWLPSGCGRVLQPIKPSAAERLLFSFERPTMLPMVGGTAPRALVTEHATDGKRSLRLNLSPGNETVIIDSGGFPLDWRGWRVLKVDVYREGAPLSLNLRITDVHQRRHWVWNKRITPGANTLEYDIPSLRGKMDLSAVTELMWYAEQPSGEISLDAIRLSK
ncbi:MAG: hypothetical protein KatS3mg023_2388 [Armatimonadota bacterium]|nr:MAG: hypothetical protein KatS3mg023_2388 [Armatimonadota bacterium]